MTTGWTIEIDATHDDTLTDDELVDLAERFRPYGGALAVGDGMLGVTFSIDNTIDAPAAASKGATIFRNQLLEPDDYTIVRLHARTHAVHDADLAEPVIPDLVGVAELAELLGVSTQRASELRSRAGFPRPAVTLRSGPVWVRANVEQFASTWKRKPGRPPKADQV